MKEKRPEYIITYVYVTQLVANMKKCTRNVPKVKKTGAAELRVRYSGVGQRLRVSDRSTLCFVEL